MLASYQELLAGLTVCDAVEHLIVPDCLGLFCGHFPQLITGNNYSRPEINLYYDVICRQVDICIDVGNALFFDILQLIQLAHFPFILVQHLNRPHNLEVFSRDVKFMTALAHDQMCIVVGKTPPWMIPPQTVLPNKLALLLIVTEYCVLSPGQEVIEPILRKKDRSLDEKGLIEDRRSIDLCKFIDMLFEIVFEDMEVRLAVESARLQYMCFVDERESLGIAIFIMGQFLDDK